MRRAFERVGCLDKFPMEDRWRCTLELSDRLPGLHTHFLDDVLEECGFDRRDEDADHDAYNDAKLAAKCYMHMVKLPEPYKSKLGFCKE